MFKKRRGIHIPYNKQGLIYFTCVNIDEQPDEIKNKIISLCHEVGKDDFKALYDVITTNKSILAISLEYYISEKKLYTLRKRFYESWEKNLP